jgi:hypothetical protein
VKILLLEGEENSFQSIEAMESLFWLHPGYNPVVIEDTRPV